MTWRDRNGPRPPRLHHLEHQLQQHIRQLTARSPRYLGRHKRSPFVPLLQAHRDWQLASHSQRPQSQGTPADRVPEIEAGPA
ncbi:MAG: hypothetical protein ACRDTF_13610, partial [Pseudonocardiaceae bacterium]